MTNFLECGAWNVTLGQFERTVCFFFRVGNMTVSSMPLILGW